MIGAEIKELIYLLSKLPGLGPRSGRRAALHLMRHREKLLAPLAGALKTVFDCIKTCQTCGNLDTQDPCTLCLDTRRDVSLLCVVEDVADLWALERANIFKGRYHVLGGTLSALDGVGPDDLKLSELVARAEDPDVKEVILALSATVDGQTTGYYVMNALESCGVSITALAHGVPVGGELDYLDDGTLSAALSSRTSLSQAGLSQTG